MNAIPVEQRSGNVYADLGSADSEAMLIKARLVTEIAEIIRTRGLTQGQAATILGLTQPKVSALLNGRFRGISERRLLDCLTLRFRTQPRAPSAKSLRHSTAQALRCEPSSPSRRAPPRQPF
jgi:predicted XRE-type DNA-binding protein